MNRNIIRLAALLLPLLGMVSSCSDKEDIVFDHEQAAFETKADAILMEAIMPASTTAEEDVYIVGAFNGLDDKSVIGNEKYKLTPSETIAEKRGIYLNPHDFVNGKTLADGYHFVSSAQRNEVSALGDTIIRTENPAVGTRTNVYITKWAAYFDPAPEEVTHDGFVVYVDNQTTWDTLTLYMWGDVNDLNGGWPGMAPTGTVVVDGTTYTYFDMGEANAGLAENLIFNNNGGGLQLPDFAYTIDHDVYLRITDTGVEELNAGPKHDGFVVYVDNQTTWDALTLYMWGDVNDLNGGWPGMAPTGTQTIKGVTYTYFDMGEANTGLKENLIFNNNNGGSQLSDFAYTIDHDVYLRITDSGVEEIGGSSEEKPADPAAETFRLFVDNQTGWENSAMYVWGDTELFGGWPGAAASSTQEIDGVTYQVWEIGKDGATYHLILNNNGGGEQFDCPDALTATQDYYYKVTDAGWTKITPASAKRNR